MKTIQANQDCPTSFFTFLPASFRRWDCFSEQKNTMILSLIEEFFFATKIAHCYTFQCDERFASLTIRSDCSFSGRMFRNHVCLYMIHLQLKAKGEAQTQTKCIHSFQLLMNQQKKTYVFSDWLIDEFSIDAFSVYSEKRALASDYFFARLASLQERVERRVAMTTHRTTEKLQNFSQICSQSF